MLHEVGFCAFETPDDWLALPGTGASRATRDGLLASAVVSHRWDLAAGTAAVWGEALREALETEPDRDRVLAAGPVPVEGGPGDGYRIVHATEGRGGKLTRTVRVCLACGPLSCHLAVMDFAPPPDAERSLAEAVASTLRLRRVERLAELRPAPVLAEASETAPGAGARQPYPNLGVSLEVPAGWQSAAEEGAAVLTGRGCELRVQRPAADRSEPAGWFGGRVEELAVSGEHHLRSWERAELPGGPPAVGLRYVHEERTSSWTRPATVQCVDLLTLGGSPIEWRLRVREGWFPDQLALLRRLPTTVQALPEEECRMKAPVPWLPVELPGRWVAMSGGTYVRPGPPEMLLQVNRFPCPGKLEGARPTVEQVVSQLRDRASLIEVLHQDEALGVFRGLEAYRFAFDARLHDVGVRGIRGVGVLAERVLYSVVLRGDDPAEVDRLFLGFLEALTVPGIRPLERPLGANGGRFGGGGL